jgi:hypothetical protein
MSDLPDLFDSNVDTLLEIEHATANKAVKPFLAPFRQVMAMLAALWPGDNADPMAKQAAIARLNVDLMLMPLGEAELIILGGALTALEHGIEAGQGMAAASGVDVPTPFKRQLPEAVASQAQGLQRSVRAQLTQAKAMLREASTLEQAMQAVTVASPQRRVEATARAVTNKASNLGLNAVADSSPDLVQVWRAERDACVNCLAYQGHRRVWGGYPGGLTFGKKPLTTERVSEPPLHPNCRCTQWVVEKEAASGIQAGLLREAQRSILRGWAVESESTSVRVDAARRLLAKQPAMPKSVQAYARKAVRDGAFARGSQFPGAL